MLRLSVLVGTAFHSLAPKGRGRTAFLAPLAGRGRHGNEENPISAR